MTALLTNPIVAPLIFLAAIVTSVGIFLAVRSICRWALSFSEDRSDDQ